ncbi:MAG: serine/threonine protein kinase [Anaerolinea sp.]|nr:serine/threonine protein kinase [Anaerolinea sp.]
MGTSTTPDISFTGQTIQHYLLQERVKRRPVSSLYLAQDTRSGEPMFIELLHTTVQEDDALAGRFRRRMETVSKLTSPYIAPILTTSQTDEKRPFAVIKHTPGTFLADKLAEQRPSDALPDVQNALAVVRCLAQALSVAHPAGIIHHDLRPDNIYIQDNGAPYLLDLSVTISPLPIDETILKETQLLDYAASEQLRGQALSGRSNIFSLGVILYEMLTNERPRLPHSEWDIFDRRVLPKEVPLEDVRSDLTKETYELVKNCLWQQEWNRYSTIQELIQAVDDAIEAEKRGPVNTPSHAAQKKRLWQLFGLIAGGLLLILLLVTAVVLLL